MALLVMTPLVGLLSLAFAIFLFFHMSKQERGTESAGDRYHDEERRGCLLEKEVHDPRGIRRRYVDYSNGFCEVGEKDG